MGGSLSLIKKKLDNASGTDPCVCDTVIEDCIVSAAVIDNKVEPSLICTCNPCKCDPCECGIDRRVMEPLVESEKEVSFIDHAVNVEVIESSDFSKTIIVWGQKAKEDADVKEKCEQCTCDDCNCIDCGNSGGTCCPLNESDISALAAKFNPDINETHLKCLNQNGCPCNPCSCYPFKCKPHHHEDVQLETLPLEQLAEQLEKLSVDPSVESDKGVVSEMNNTCTLDEQESEIEKIIDESNNTQIVESN